MKTYTNDKTQNILNGLYEYHSFSMKVPWVCSNNDTMIDNEILYQTAMLQIYKLLSTAQQQPKLWLGVAKSL